MKNSVYKYHEYIDNYIYDIRQGKLKTSIEVKKAMDLVELKLDDEDVFIDSDKIYAAQKIIEETFEIRLKDWELFLLAIVHCYYKSSDTLVFDEFLIAKEIKKYQRNFIDVLAWYLTTSKHGIKNYNIDIVSDKKKDAKSFFLNIYNMINNKGDILENIYRVSKEEITSLKTNSYIRYNSANPNTKDGRMSACLIFYNIHKYKNYDVIDNLTCGFGKTKHSRVFKIVNQYCNNDVLAKELKLANAIVNNKNGTGDKLSILPLIYKINNEVDRYEKPSL